MKSLKRQAATIYCSTVTVGPRRGCWQENPRISYGFIKGLFPTPPCPSPRGLSHVHTFSVLVPASSLFLHSFICFSKDDLSLNIYIYILIIYITYYNIIYITHPPTQKNVWTIASPTSSRSIAGWSNLSQRSPGHPRTPRTARSPGIARLGQTATPWRLRKWQPARQSKV